MRFIIYRGKYNVNDFMATCQLKFQLYNYCTMPEIQCIYKLKLITLPRVYDEIYNKWGEI
jgi:hypothetical protein